MQDWWTIEEAARHFEIDGARTLAIAESEGIEHEVGPDGIVRYAKEDLYLAVHLRLQAEDSDYASRAKAMAFADLPPAHARRVLSSKVAPDRKAELARLNKELQEQLILRSDGLWSRMSLSDVVIAIIIILVLMLFVATGDAAGFLFYFLVVAAVVIYFAFIHSLERKLGQCPERGCLLPIIVCIGGIAGATRYLIGP